VNKRRNIMNLLRYINRVLFCVLLCSCSHSGSVAIRQIQKEIKKMQRINDLCCKARQLKKLMGTKQGRKYRNDLREVCINRAHELDPAQVDAVRHVVDNALGVLSQHRNEAPVGEAQNDANPDQNMPLVMPDYPCNDGQQRNNNQHAPLIPNPFGTTGDGQQSDQTAQSSAQGSSILGGGVSAQPATSSTSNSQQQQISDNHGQATHECPICYDERPVSYYRECSNYINGRMCGYRICRDCAGRVYTCPQCRRIACFVVV